MTVNRFSPSISCGPPCVGTMEPDPKGEWVSYADYQALLARSPAPAQSGLKPCTCDNPFGGSIRCGRQQGMRLGEGWYCQKQRVLGPSQHRKGCPWWDGLKCNCPLNDADATQGESTNG